MSYMQKIQSALQGGDIMAGKRRLSGTLPPVKVSPRLREILEKECDRLQESFGEYIRKAIERRLESGK
jgi:predicted HicB family RNase H-like nuclease